LTTVNLLSSLFTLRQFRKTMGLPHFGQSGIKPVCLLTSDRGGGETPALSVNNSTI
jgi:hypothetical protein